MQEEQKSKSPISREQVLLTGGTLLASGVAEVALHAGPGGLLAGAAATIVMAQFGPDIINAFVPSREATRQVVGVTSRVAEKVSPPSDVHTDQSTRAKLKRLISFQSPTPIKQDVSVQSEEAPDAPEEGDLPEYFEDEEYNDEDELEMFNPGLFTFSQVLRDFTPSLRSIYLGSLPDGTPVYSDAKGLCHVALGGSTGGGKSSLIRLLMSQLCKSGASVLLLNPHYTRYDVEHEEDWTPFEPYLVHDPMECRKYEVIEHYLKQVATVLLPKRLEKYARSQPLGKPYFLVLDELPAIVANIPDAPKYLATILREGRKVGIFLITAAQDFLVKTIAPQANQGGGAIRDCYRTAYYVGGDPTTAKVLLDVPAKEIQESLLGKGMAMLRSAALKVAKLVRVPYVDNAALYKLLGPSTYTSFSDSPEDDLFLEDLQPVPHHTEPYYQAMSEISPNPYREVPRPLPEVRPSTAPKPQPAPTGRVTPKLTPELQRVWDVYVPGMSHRELAQALAPDVKVSHVTAGKYLQRLKDLRMIGADGNYLVSR